MKRTLRFKREKKRVSFLRKRVFWYATGVLLLVASLFYVVVFSPWLQIQEVQVSGAHEIAPEHVVAAVESGFWQSFLGIPQNSILLAKTAQQSVELQKEFPLIASVFVRRSLPKTLTVQITERKQVGTWCKESLCFAIDKGGVPFKAVENTGDYAMFASSGTLSLGKELLDPPLLNSLLEFEKTFQETGELARFFVASFTIQDTGQVEAQTKQGWHILLDTKESMEWQQTKLKLVLQEKIPLEKREKLAYIDLRFGDQAYVKYRD